LGVELENKIQAQIKLRKMKKGENKIKKGCKKKRGKKEKMDNE